MRAPRKTDDSPGLMTINPYLRRGPALRPLPLTLRRLAWGKTRAQALKPYTPEAAQSFVDRGRLLTTPEMMQFLIHHDIEPDNSRMKGYYGGPELKQLVKEYGINIYFSTRHVLFAHDLRYFDPRGHPLGAMMRTELARRVRDVPLWIQCTTSASSTKAMVATITRRRMVGAIHGALAKEGYNLAPGKGPDKAVWGTLYLRIWNPVKTSAHSPEPFGTLVAQAIDSNWPRRT
ncbi:hypothetical protein XA68_14449 [Ophiocordyceps unilateralis]|uniref:Uncharacterized protein n=1 Tax=Ophiocordyceps unilateralis TaxID=268505 RepID=A0A2A9P995_OPHUN|nr:hypothetical protein XA68_14449 [Ophiocordyceps unilateralis]